MTCLLRRAVIVHKGRRCQRFKGLEGSRAGTDLRAQAPICVQLTQPQIIMDRTSSPARSPQLPPAVAPQSPSSDSKTSSSRSVVSSQSVSRPLPSPVASNTSLGKRSAREADTENPKPSKEARTDNKHAGTQEVGRPPTTFSDLPDELQAIVAAFAATGQEGPDEEATGDAWVSAAHMLNTLKDRPPETPLSDLTRRTIASQGWGFLRGLPEAERSRAICLECVGNDGLALELVPLPLRDYLMCLTAVKQHGRILEIVPKEHRDRKMCLAAVQENGFALQDVPEALRDQEMCMAAVQQHGFALESVPEPLKTPEMCMAAVRNYGLALMDVPDEVLDHALCLAAVEQDGLALEHVPEELRDLEICLAAVRQDARASGEVPDSLWEEVARLANL